MDSVGTGEIEPYGGDAFYSSVRDNPSMEIVQTGGLLPAEEALPGSPENVVEEGSSQPDFAFALREDPDNPGDYIVLAGSVNSINVPQYSVPGTPSEIWLNVTVSAGTASSATISTSSSGSDSETNTSRKIASPTWDSDTLVTAGQGIKGSQNIVSCGASHGWSSLYI